MKRIFPGFSVVGLFPLACLLVAPDIGSAQFISFNAQAASASNGLYTTVWNVFGRSPGASGHLKGQTGEELPVVVSITTNGPVNPGPGGAVPAGTPLDVVFSGSVDLAGGGALDACAEITTNSSVTYTFTGLRSDRVYSFKAGAVGASSDGTAALQWSLWRLEGALSFSNAHTAGCYTNGLAADQVALNTGLNTGGDLADWEEIAPGPDGTFSVSCTQYTGPIPSGVAASGPHGHALSGFRLEEFVPGAPRLVSIVGRDDRVLLGFSIPVDASSVTNLSNYSLANSDGPVEVLKASVGSRPELVELRTAQQMPFAAHSLAVHGITDASTGTNAIAPYSGGVYTNIALTTGYLTVQFYRGIAGTNLASLTNNANYPNSPSRVSYFHDSYWYDSTIGNNYGSRASGFLLVPETGDYTFVVYSYGASVLLLSTNEDATGLRRIADCSNVNYRPSAPISLMAGQRYYFEMLTKEGSSAQDFVQLVWSRPPQTNNWSLIPMQNLGNYLTVAGATIDITEQPANASVYNNRQATFRVTASSNSKVVPEPDYQWQCNGTNIPNATSSTYTTPLVYETNSGAVYRVLLKVPGAALYSSNATLTVTRDIEPPVVVKALNFGPQTVQLLFSEEIDFASAWDMSHYHFANGTPILGVSLDFAQTTVSLTTAPLQYGSNYTLVLNGLRDRAMIPNQIPDNTQVAVIPVKPDISEVGDPAIAPAIVEVADGVNVSGGGRDIGGNRDQFAFYGKLFSGDFDLKVRVADLSGSDLWAKAGLMARETLESGSRFTAALITPSMNGAQFAWREGTNAPANNSGSFPANYPDSWLRLVRSGSGFSGFASYDGHTWTSLGGAYFTNVPPLLYVGVALTSRTTNSVAAAQFRDIQATGEDATIGKIENPREALGPSSRKTPIVISEIMYRPAPRTNGLNLEFIELYNSNPWFHDIGGYRLVADNMSYTFPVGTVLQGGAFLTVAASPGDLGRTHGITNIFGPYSGSLKKSGTLQLFDEHNALLLTIPYSNKYPWPVAADGAGHSIVLANPSYGEEDPRAWGLSERLDGSPGRMESFSPGAVRNVVINEVLAHTDNPALRDFIELYNHSDRTNDLSGCILTDDPDSAKYIFPAGTILRPRSFLSLDETQLGFALKAEGETLYLFAADRSRVLDAVQYEGQADSVSVGRSPDGADDFYPLAGLTPAAPNSAIRIGDVVINELMYNPISRNDDDQFLELYNQGTNAFDLGGWRFTAGITFEFPTNTILEAGRFLVLARNRTNLLAKYPTLDSATVLGDFGGKLSHNGERVALARPETVRDTNTVFVVEDEVTYGTGGRWGQWSSGGGSSLELLNPRSNHRLAANWADSDDTKKSEWVTIENTGVLDNGTSFGSGLGYVQIGQLDAGECLVDNVEVKLTPESANLVKNPGFEAGGLNNWSVQGCMIRSSIENSGYNSPRSLHIRCSSRIWTGVNSCQAALNTGLGANKTATLRFKAKWLHGSPEILMRVKGNYLEAVGNMLVPSNLGTPGEPNSRLLSNPGPAIYDVAHTPALPDYGEQVVVTAKASDVDGIRSLTLNYRADSTEAYTAVPMKDDGKDGDALAGDGIYSAVIPGVYYQSPVGFYVAATDKVGVNKRFPATVNDNAPARECLVMFGDQQRGGSFAGYHLWISQTNMNRWTSLPDLSNEMIDCTFVNGKRIIYNMQARYSGSPYHQGFYSPQYSQCHFKWVFPDDDKFLGATSFNKIHTPGNGPGDDSSLQREQAAYTFMRALGVPWLNRRYATVFVNGYNSIDLMEDTQCPDNDMIKEYWPEDSEGYLYKMQPWFEFDPLVGSGYASFENVDWCKLLSYTTTTPAGKVKKPARYRYTFQPRRSPDLMNNFTNVFSLVDAALSYNTPDYVANLEGVADMENWMRVFAANHAAGNWDSFGTQNGQNLYGYIGTKGTRYTLLMFDFNIVLGNSGSWSPGQNLFASSDGTLGRMYSNPTFRRMYYRALQELVDGPLDAAQTGPLVDAKYRAFVDNGFSVEGPANIKNWLTAARKSISSQIASGVNVAFAVNPEVVVSNNYAIVSGTAPVKVKTITLGGIRYPVTWTSLVGWTALVPLKPGTNVLSVVGVDIHGQPIPGTESTLSIISEQPDLSPVGHVVFSELMFTPPLPGAEFIELQNTAPDAAFDLSGWELRGLGYTFPPGTLLAPGKTLVLAADRNAFAAAYGATNPVFATFSQPLSRSAMTLSLISAPGTEAEQVVAAVRYENAAPWPDTSAHTSLELIDAGQDNWRVANWGSATNALGATPGRPNSMAQVLPRFPSVFLNEVQPENLSGITNSAGQRVAWLELFNPSTNQIPLDGLFLSSSYTNLAEWAFPPGAVLAPGEFRIVFADAQTNLDSAQEWHASFLLTPGTGSLAVSSLDTNGLARVLDYITYTNLGPDRSLGSVPEGQSLVRQELVHPTPGGSNDTSGVVLTIAINEWMAANTFTLGDPVTGKFEDWFELYNYGDKPIDLAGCYLSDSLDNPREFLVPTGYVLQPHSYLLAWADKVSTNGTPDLHTSFKLAKEGGTISLYGPDGRLVDYISYGPQTSDLSMGRYPDGERGSHYLPGATPRSANLAPNTAPVIAALSTVFVTRGRTLVYSPEASDNDLPAQTLHYWLASELPVGASFDSVTRQFTWTPGEKAATNWVRFAVTDNGVPSLSSTQNLMIAVVPAPALGGVSLHEGQLALEWPSVPGQSYQLEYKLSLLDNEWRPAGDAILGTGDSLALTNQWNSSSNGFFRLRLLP